ncbi:MAG TPA: FG-GAP-like repeat-containing protein [Flavobacteriales bacterium]|nr:FG-GAP-like repeat-containing protein [Flavobacteriales bacterium]HNU55168.1 FG-GAP-like repeat-containing protein [Flavobacteriales bacterium]
MLWEQGYVDQLFDELHHPRDPVFHDGSEHPILNHQILPQMGRIPSFALLAAGLLASDLQGQFNPGVLFVQNIPDVQEIRVLDLDGVNGADVIVRLPNSLVWLRNENGIGNFPAMETIHGSIDLLDAFDFADVEGDGDLDLVIGDRGSDAILLLRNDGTGAFGPQEVVLEMNGGVAHRIRLADAFGGPDPELFYLSGTVQMLVNQGGVFDPPVVVTQGGGMTFDFELLDVDTDGDLDVAAFEGLTPALKLWLNPGTVGEQWATIMPAAMASIGGHPVQVMDVDGDGDEDLANASNHMLGWWGFPFIGNGPYLLSGGGAVAGSSVSPYRRGHASRLGCGTGAAMIWTDSIGEPVQWSTYDPVLGAFAPISILPELPSFQAIHSGDVNSDGKEDLVLWHDNNLSWFANAISDPVTTVALTPFDVLCIAGDPYVLDHANPEGGVWRGPGVEAGVFTPEDPGTFELSYSVVDEVSGCPVVASQSLEVISTPTLNLLAGTPELSCAEDTLIYEATPAGGVWGGVADANGMVDRSCAARPVAGTVAYYMNAVNGGECVAYGELIQSPACVIVSLGPDRSVCHLSDTLVIDVQRPMNAGITIEGVDEEIYPSPINAVGLFYPVHPPGSYEIIATVIAPNYCPGRDTMYVEVLPAPDVTFDLNAETILNGEVLDLGTIGQPEGGVYLIESDTVVHFAPVGLAVGSAIAIEYFYTDPETGCSSGAVDTIIIDGTVGFDHLQARPTSALRPNPASTIVRVQNPTTGGLRILDGLGRVVLQGSVPEGDVALDVSTLRPGTYWVEVTSPSGAWRDRLIVAR